ncbi:MAG: TIGR01458 family HAD-type hydrolase [Parvibaculum sp.]|nr:TIGR01458 family HAD-type hydrolase [Parvibaculum sp.]
MTPELKPLNGVEGLLLDAGGVLYQNDSALPGATEAVQRLRAGGMPFLILTNTTRTTRGALAKKLESFGFDVSEEEIVTPASVAHAVLDRDGAKPHLLVHPGLLPDCPEEAVAPNAVLIGDAGDAFTFERMNRAFRVLIEGGRLYALGRNRFFMGRDGFELDAGPFVAALEYAAGVEAILIGKPARGFFTAAADMLGVTREKVMMVGDDLESDIEGAIAAGLHAVLVRTGKYREGDGLAAKKSGALVAASLAEFVETLKL